MADDKNWQWEGTSQSTPPTNFVINKVNENKLAKLTIYQGFGGNSRKNVWTLVPDNLTWENEITHETQNALDTFKNAKTGLINKVKEASNFVTGQQFMLKHQNAELWKSSSVKKDFTIKFIFWWGMCDKYNAKDEVWLPIMKLVDNFDLEPIKDNENGYAPPIMPVAEFMKSMVANASSGENKIDESNIASSTDTIKESQSAARDERIKEITDSINNEANWAITYNNSSNTKNISGYNVYFTKNQYKIADGTIAINKSFSTAEELAKYIYDEQAKTDKENGISSNEVKISSGVLENLTSAVSAVYGKVDKLIEDTMEKSQFVKLQIGKSSLIDAIVKKCTWSFDYTEVDSDGYPYSGSVQLSLHQCHIPVLKEIEEEYTKVN